MLLLHPPKGSSQAGRVATVPQKTSVENGIHFEVQD